MFRMRLDGDERLNRALKQLPEKVQKRVQRKAVNAALAPIRKAMRANAPRVTQTLKKSIRSKVVTYRQATFGIAGAANKVIVVRGRKYNAANYAHLVEYGTRPHAIWSVWIPEREEFIPIVHHPGTPANPFMRKSWEGKQRTAFQEFVDKAWKELTIEAHKLARGGR
jgi:HK97 gp10 family phage protein